LLDAELFGNLANYPNAGMPARRGLIGEADGSTLFLDEFAELPAEQQAHLLRVLDAGGEYQALGDARTRRSDLRLVAATNRDPSELRHDVLARFTVRVHVPGLRDRAEDVPLLLRHLLRAAASRGDVGAARFLTRTPTGLEPRLDPDLVEALVLHPFTHHVRELDGLLWRAIAGSPRDYVAFPRDLREELLAARTTHGLARQARAARADPTLEEVRACLSRNSGHVERTALELGLPSRYALYRLLKKHGIALERG
jgi:two-component system nitrogen regulation response regulator GlnG/two-component system response regulator HydG